MRFSKLVKTVGSVVMVLSLLVGMVSVMGPFPMVAAEIESPDWEFNPDFSATAGEGNYDFSADNEANNKIRDAVDAQFNVYHQYGGTVTKLTKAQIGTKVNDSWNGTEIQLKAMANGLNLYTKQTAYSNLTMRNSLTLVPKDAEGNEINTKNFEISFNLRSQLQWSHGGFLLQFGSQESGKTIVGDNTPYAQRAAILITADGMGIIDGAETSAANTSLYQKPATASVHTKFPTGYDTGNGNGTSPEMQVYVKVVNGKVTVKLTKVGEETPFVNTEANITWTKAGTIAFTGLLSNQYLSKVVVNKLDENGDRIQPEEDNEGGSGEGEGGSGEGGEGEGGEDPDPEDPDDPPTPPASTFPEITDPNFTFTPDFSATAGAGNYDFSANTEVNNAIRDAIDVKFNVYAGCESNYGKVEKADLGKDNDFDNNWSNSVVQLKATANGLNLLAKTDSYGNRNLRNWISLVPKDADGNEINTKNLEVSFDFIAHQRWTTDGMIMLSFRSQESGRVATGESAAYTNRTAVIIGTQGAGVVDGETNKDLLKSGFTAANKNTLYTAYTTGAAGSAGNQYTTAKAHVKVVNDKVTVKITAADGETVMLEQQFTVSNGNAGTIAIAGLQGDHKISNVVLNLLDENGDRIQPEEDNEGGSGEGEGEGTQPETPTNDFAFAPDFSATAGEGNYDFSADNEANNKIRDAVDAQFNVYHQYGETVTKLTKAQIGTQMDDDWNGSEIQLKAMANGLNLYTIQSNYYNHTMRNSLTLVPKDAKGNEINTKNFEVSFNLKTQLQWSHGGFMLQFRSQKSGKTIVVDEAPYAQRAAILITADGMGIIDGAETSAENTTLYQKPTATSVHTEFPEGYNTGNGTSPEMQVYVKVVNGKVTVKLTKEGEETPFVDTEANITWTKAGTIGFTGLLSNNYVSNIVLKKLDDAGEVVVPKEEEFENGNIVIEREDVLGSATKYSFIVTVAPEGNAQLKAGSLRARVKGSTGPYNILPKRVGFRDLSNTQSDQFVFESEEELEFTADFYTPADESEANMVILGTSKTDSEDKNIGKALRFISRFYVYYNNGKFYMDINGQAKEVKDFGAYVTSRLALKALKQDTIENAIKAGKTNYIVKRRVGKLGVFYDYCDAYVDTSIQVTQLTAAMLNQEIVSCTYIEFADGQIVYTDQVSSTYAGA